LGHAKIFNANISYSDASFILEFDSNSIALLVGLVHELVLIWIMANFGGTLCMHLCGRWQLQPKVAQIRVHKNLPTRH